MGWRLIPYNRCAHFYLRRLGGAGGGSASRLFTPTASCPDIQRQTVLEPRMRALAASAGTAAGRDVEAVAHGPRASRPRLSTGAVNQSLPNQRSPIFVTCLYFPCSASVA